MKKTILSFLLIGSAAAVMAQQPATPTTNSSSNTNRYNNTNNTNQNNNNPNANNSNLNNNQNMTNPNPVNNSVSPTTNGTVSPTNAGRDTSMSNNGSQIYDNSATGTPYQPTNSTNQTLNGSNTANTPAGTMAASSVNVPPSIRSSFSTSYPSVTGNAWSRSGDWYVTRYVENGSIKQVSYREDGKTLTTTASPVRSTFVSDDAMSQAIQKYGANVYSVNTVRGANGQDMYAVRVIENGQARTIYMNQDGSAEENYYRTEENANANLQTGQQQQVTTQPATQPVQEKSVNSGNIRSDSLATPMYNKQQQQSNMNQQQMESPKKQNQEYDNNNLNKEGINNASDTTAPKRKDQ